MERSEIEMKDCFLDVTRVLHQNYSHDTEIQKEKRQVKDSENKSQQVPLAVSQMAPQKSSNQ